MPEPIGVSLPVLRTDRKMITCQPVSNCVFQKDVERSKVQVRLFPWNVNTAWILPSHRSLLVLVFLVWPPLPFWLCLHLIARWRDIAFFFHLSLECEIGKNRVRERVAPPPLSLLHLCGLFPPLQSTETSLLPSGNLHTDVSSRLLGSPWMSIYTLIHLFLPVHVTGSWCGSGSATVLSH